MNNKRVIGISASGILGGADYIFNNLINYSAISTAILNIKLKGKIEMRKNVTYLPFENIDRNFISILIFIKNYFSILYKLSKVIHKNDQIICNDFLALVYGFPFKYINKTFIIFYCHSAFINSLFNKVILAAFINFTSNKIIVPSYYLKNELIGIGINKNKITVIYNGIEIYSQNKLLNSTQNQPLKIGIIGGIHHQKGQDNFVEALKHLKDKGFETKGYIVGSIYEPYFHKLLKEKTIEGYEDLIEYTGFLGYSQTLELMTTFDIIICASKYRETLPNVLLEALSLKKPVIGTRVGGIPEIVEDRVNGILVPADNYLAIANAILELKEPSVRKRMGDAGFNIYLNKFTLKKYLYELNREFF